MTIQRRRTVTRSPDGKPIAGNPTEPTRLEVRPARRVILPLAAINLDNLGIGELLTAAEVLNTDLEGLAALMKSQGIPRARFLVALAWVIARRDEPALTWAEAQRWRIEVEVGSAEDPLPPEPPSGELDGSPA